MAYWGNGVIYEGDEDSHADDSEYRNNQGASTSSTDDTPSNHIMFVIDVSKSMSKHDVASLEGSGVLSRYQAVTECIYAFVEDQKQQPQACGDRYSLILFEDHAWTPKGLNGAVFANAPARLRKELSCEEPCGGTHYGNALHQVFVCCDRLDKLWDIDMHVVVFLSDGRPCDLHTNCRYEEPAIQHLRSLIDLLGDRLQLHTVGFGREHLYWLQKMADIAGGAFHDHTIVGNRGGQVALLSSCALMATFKHISSDLTELRSSSLCNNNNSSSSGQQHHHYGAAQQQPLRPMAKQVDFEPRNDYMTRRGCGPGSSVHFDGVRIMVFENNNFVGKWRGVSADMRAKPFAAGGQRLAYHLFHENGPVQGHPTHLVAKPSKFVEAQRDAQAQLEAHKPAFRALRTAQACARTFNAQKPTHAQLGSAHGAKVVVPVEPIAFQEAFLYVLPSDSGRGGSRYVPAEAFLRCVYTKYNGNNGYVDPQYAAGSLTGMRARRQTGVGTTYTDPQVHSVKQSYGPADLGAKGFRKFFETHVCGSICRTMDLHTFGL